MAQVIFANICKKYGNTDFVIKGAGTATSNGEPITPLAVEALRACGEKIPAQLPRSTRWNEYMLDEFDHIVCMTQGHAYTIDSSGEYLNVYTLDSVTGCGDVFDPWRYPIEIYIDVCIRLQQDLEVLYIEICKTLS